MDMIKRLGEICNIVSGGTPSRTQTKFWENGNIPWIKIGDIKSKYVNEANEHITQEGLDGSSAKLLQKGTILYTIFATLGEVGILTIEACTNQAIAGITIKNQEEVLPDYLYYYLKSKKAHINEIGRGVAQNNINMSILRGLNVPLPSVQNQQKIAEILDMISNLIVKHKQQLEKLDELIKARFVEMFGDPFVNEKKWDVKKISEVVTEVRYGTSKPAVDGGKYPYLRMNNITDDGELDLNNLKYIDITDEEIEKCIVHKGDILFNRTNSIELVGKTAMYNLDEKMVIAGYIIRVRLKSCLLPEVLTQYMNLKPLKILLRSVAKGAVNQANINAQEFQNIEIYVPNIDLQNEFVSFKNHVDKSKVAVQKEFILRNTGIYLTA